MAQGSAVAVDGSGNVYITGTFSGTVNFDPNAGNTSLTAWWNGGSDVFVEKLDGAGNLAWVQQVQGSSGATDEGYAIAVDGQGDVYAGGTFSGTATFGSISLTSQASSDAFVEKLNGAGAVQWASATGGSGSSVAQVSGLAVDGAGNVLTTGFYAGTVDFDPGPGTTDLTSAGSRDVFVMKLDGSGNLSWAEGIGGPDVDQGNAIATDASGASYVTGTFSDTVNFNPRGGTTDLTAGGFEDGFILKLDASGNLAWARALTGAGVSFAQGAGIGVDGSGTVDVAGYFTGTLQYNPGPPAGILTSAGSYDVFVAQFDGSGNPLSAMQAGGSGFDSDTGIGVNAAGDRGAGGPLLGPRRVRRHHAAGLAQHEHLRGAARPVQARPAPRAGQPGPGGRERHRRARRRHHRGEQPDLRREPGRGGRHGGIAPRRLGGRQPGRPRPDYRRGPRPRRPPHLRGPPGRHV